MAFKEWLSEYGGLAFKLPDLAGKYEGRNLIICGDSAGVWSDLEAFGARDNSGRGKVHKPEWDLMTVNKIVETIPASVEHVYSNMPRVIHAALAARRDEYKREFTFEPHVHSCNPGAQYHWPWPGHGTSGLGACFVAIALGYERIVLCGMPLEDGPHNGEPHWRTTTFATSEASGTERDDRDAHWKRAITLGFHGKVKSMSGRTRNWLGAPEWR